MPQTPLLSLRGGLMAKLENTQPTGSFKVRPAFYGILSSLSKARQKGVVAASSGNFAQAVAYAAKELGISAQVVIMSTSCEFKRDRTECWGAKVILCGSRFEDRERVLNEVASSSGALKLHPFDSWETICGDASLALELLDQIEGDFDVWVCVSGGGLLAGVAAVLTELRPGCRVYGVQPERNASMKLSFDQGKRVEVPRVESIADALIATIPGEQCFEIIRQRVEDIHLVSEAAILEAVREVWVRHQIRLEPGAAVGYAAHKIFGERRRPQVLLFTGANISESRWKALVEK